MTVYFMPIGSGIGDILVCKPAFEWLVKNCDDAVFLVARGPRQSGLSRLLEGAAGEIEEPHLKSIQQPEDRVVNLREHHWQTSHDWFSPEFKARFPELRISQILQDICKLHHIQANHNEIKPLHFSPDKRSENKIILVPGTTMKSKKLAADFWLNVNARLRNRGIQTILLGKTDEQPLQELMHDIAHLETADLQEAINLISSCRGVISVDTGLMHIAVQQQIKTIAIYGVCEVYYRPAAHCYPIFTHILKVADEKPQFDRNANPRFSTTFDTWEYLPASAETGEFLEFSDYDRLLGLLEEAEMI